MQVLIGHELVNGEQLDRSHAEPTKVLEGRGCDQPRVGAAQRLRDVGVARGKPLHVDFVDDRLVPGDPRRPIATPGEGRIRDDALRRVGRAVPIIPAEIFGGLTDRVAEHRIAPDDGTVDGPSIGIEQELRRIEAMTLLGLIRSAHPIAVAQPRTCVGQVDVPDVMRVLRHRDLRYLTAAWLIFEYAQVDTGSVFGEQGEIDAGAIPGGSQRLGPPRPCSRRGSYGRLGIPPSAGPHDWAFSAGGAGEQVINRSLPGARRQIDASPRPAIVRYRAGRAARSGSAERRVAMPGCTSLLHPPSRLRPGGRPGLAVDSR